MFCQTVSASNEKRDESLGKIPYVIPVPIENHAYHIEYAIRVRHSLPERLRQEGRGSSLLQNVFRLPPSK